MASKGQKFKSYPAELKEIILSEYFAALGTPRTLGLKYDVPIKTIENWITKTKHNIDVKVDHRSGGPGRNQDKNLTLEDYKERYEILKKYQVFLQARREKK